jgi:hypothetical protein
VKEELAGVTLDHSTPKKEWEGVTRSISTEEFTTASSGGSSAAKSVLRSAADTSRNDKK